MYAIIRSTTKHGTHAQERPQMICHGDFKSLLVPRLCEQIEGCLKKGASLYARIPGAAEERITPADNIYGVISAIDRGCDHIVIDIPGEYDSQSYSVHFAIEEL